MRRPFRLRVFAVAALFAILAPGLGEVASEALAASDCGDDCAGCPSEDPEGPGCCGALLVTCGCACNGAAPVEVAGVFPLRIAYAVRSSAAREPLPPVLEDWQREIFHPPAV